MNDNGKQVKMVLKIELDEGNMKINFGQVGPAIISHAIRLASLQLDNALIAEQMKAKQSEIALPDRFVK